MPSAQKRTPSPSSSARCTSGPPNAKPGAGRPSAITTRWHGMTPGRGFRCMLGLFGIFSMIRYRTEQLPIREMTYLFVLIAISIINGAGMATSYVSFIAVNVLFILIIAVLEAIGMFNRKGQKIITYEKIELIRPDRREELLADLKARTGLDIVKVQVGSIDFLKDTAFLKVTYIPDDPEPNDIDMVTKFKKN